MMVYYAEDHVVFGSHPSFNLPKTARHPPTDSCPLERTAPTSGWSCVSLERQAIDIAQKQSQPTKIFNAFSANVKDILGER
jgi:hypothetical protein